jgi:hypothetical protein
VVVVILLDGKPNSGCEIAKSFHEIYILCYESATVFLNRSGTLF